MYRNTLLALVIALCLTPLAVEILFTHNSSAEAKVTIAQVQKSVPLSMLGSPYDINHVHALEQAKIAYNKANGILGASNLIETPVALFHTSLANAITATANTMTLVSGATLDGTTLASSTYSFVIDSGTPTQEFVEADCTNTVCTNVQRGLSVITGTTTITSLEQPHRRTASIDIVDAPLLLKVASLLNGISQFPNVLVYAAPVTTTVLANGPTQAMASVAYVNLIGTSGCANASSGVRGCLQLATAIQNASSTALGSSGALLVAPASFSTSTPGMACDGSATAGALCNVVAMNNGKLSQLWTDYTQLFTFTGGLLGTASSTFSATTSIAATSTTNGALILRNIPYAAPAALNASSSVLSDDGAGHLSWEQPSNRTIFLNTNLNRSTSVNSGTTTLLTIANPANTIGGGSVMERLSTVWYQSGSNQCWAEVDFGNGVATTSMGYTSVATAAGAQNGLTELDLDIYATSTTGMYATSRATGGRSFVDAPFQGGGFSGANLAATTYFDLGARVNPGGSGTCWLYSSALEVLHQ